MRTIGKGSLQNGLYYLGSSQPGDVVSSSIVCSSSHFVSKPSFETWHNRFGHPSFKRLHVLQDTLQFDFTACKDHVYHVCPLAKQKRLSFTSNNNMVVQTFDLVHADIWGPFAHPTYHGYRYFLTIVDDSTCFTWVVLLRNKSDVLTVVPQFFTYVET